MTKRKRRMGVTAERKNHVLIVTRIKCNPKFRKGLEIIARNAPTTCHDRVAECVTSQPGNRRLIVVRASCTSPETKREFEEIMAGPIKAIESL